MPLTNNSLINLQFKLNCSKKNLFFDFNSTDNIYWFIFLINHKFSEYHCFSWSYKFLFIYLENYSNVTNFCNNVPSSKDGFFETSITFTIRVKKIEYDSWL